MDHKEASESKHYHSIEKGCKIRGLLKTREGSSLGRYCETHKKYICFCGWEWHHHHHQELKKHSLEEIKRAKREERERFNNSYIQTWDKKSKRYKVKHIDL